MANERTLTTKCVKALRDHGAFVTKIHAGPHQPIGLPDIVGCYMGTFFGIEMKMPGKENRLTQRQEKKLRDIKKAGGIAEVCTSVKQCLDVLKQIEEAPEFD
jgi:hypothetical protein